MSGIHDVSSSHAPHQLTIGGKNRFPAWTRDGTRIAFQSDREGDQGIFWQRGRRWICRALDETRKGTESHSRRMVTEWRYAPLQHQLERAEFALQQPTLHDRKVASVAGGTSNAEPQAGFSADGRWIAYAVATATRGGTSGVLVRMFPMTNVCTGSDPASARSGRRRARASTSSGRQASSRFRW